MNKIQLQQHKLKPKIQLKIEIQHPKMIQPKLLKIKLQIEIQHPKMIQLEIQHPMHNQLKIKLEAVLDRQLILIWVRKLIISK